MSKAFLQKLRMVASEADDLLTSCDASDLLDGLEVARDFMFEAASMIEELESRLAQVERERDAAVHDMKQCQSAVCNAYKHHYRPNPDVRHYECALLGKFSDIFDSDDDRPFICGKFEWRGVCEGENT